MVEFMERTRVTFDIPEHVRRAIAIYAAERSVTVGQVIETMATEMIPEYIAQAQKAIDNPLTLRKPKKKT